ncbi:MAG: hypothetical protein KDG53_18960 [Rhodocyclaceae bacterium]|nr:hypothetical protein [Rhodocyclaceae bacterium]
MSGLEGRPSAGQRWKDKVFVGFSDSAIMCGDKLATAHDLFALAMQRSGVWVGTGQMPSNSRSATRNGVNGAGWCSGAMARSPSDASVDEMRPGDLDTAPLFGRRVAGITARLHG